ncbi:hypothetical protein BaRGS_00031032 [Batillaria attramentaria]|uniref:Uncharacterized protein n=1 Tax=Batillaria attramentaria TaxID=370345 RepID=A0ABD0JSZ0_9CAEN
MDFPPLSPVASPLEKGANGHYPFPTRGQLAGSSPGQDRPHDVSKHGHKPATYNAEGLSKPALTRGYVLRRQKVKFAETEVKGDRSKNAEGFIAPVLKLLHV